MNTLRSAASTAMQFLATAAIAGLVGAALIAFADFATSGVVV